jgi:hypothetical protein
MPESELTICPKCGAVATARKKENGIVIVVCMQVGCSHEWPLTDFDADYARCEMLC